MKAISLGIIFCSLVAVAMCQFSLTPAKISSRKTFVDAHLKNLAILDSTFFDFYTFVSQTATSVFDPLLNARNSLNKACQNSGSTDTSFSDFCAQTIETLDSVLRNTGGGSSYNIIDQMDIGELSRSARNIHEYFKMYMTELAMLTTMDSPSIMSDDCADRMYKACQQLYEVNVHQSINATAEATAQITKLRDETTVLIKAAKKAVSDLTLRIKNCSKNAACLEQIFYDSANSIHIINEPAMSANQHFEMGMMNIINARPIPLWYVGTGQILNLKYFLGC